MHNLLQQILSLFTSDIIISEDIINEERSEVKVECVFSKGKLPSMQEFENIEGLNTRDCLHISILHSITNEVICNYSEEESDDFQTFIDGCKSDFNSTTEKKIIITVVKKKQGDRISVYYPEVFFKYLTTLSTFGLLSVFNKSIGADNHLVIFEIQDESFKEFSSYAIKFVPKGYVREDELDSSCRIDRINKIANLCHCELSSKYSFIPEDFFPIIESDSEILSSLFKKLTLFYAIVFLFDITELEELHIKYKLNGYRTITQRIITADIDINSYELYYQIYQWVYDGGNTIDKIGLARNIISLNLTKDTLALSETTFDAIKSGYNVYQKENINQYIEIRNKISDQLIELQEKADKIVASFVSDYKRSIFTVLSFFITVIVIEVVSNGSYIDGFTIEVTLLSIGFLLISLLLMFFSRWEINKELVRYKNTYDNLKNRYTDLLDSSDINRILNNDVDFQTNKQFIEERRQKYTILWVVSLSILFVIIVLLYFINNPCQTVSTMAHFIKNFMICCFIKSM